jgi:dTDP-4-amino-4,6-dideoxygalactose transaminase
VRLRHQLAVYSPIPVRAVSAAFAAALGFAGDSRDQLASLLRGEYDADEVLLCGSGTQALQVAIECARSDVGKDAIVALPAFSCFDVASAAVGAAARVALYDLDPLTLSPDLDSLQRVLAGGAKILVIAPLYGIPVDWDGVERLATQYGALLIEDAAQGHGARYRDKPLGSLGDLRVLSFGRGKGWTGGSGGAVLFRRSLRSPASSISAAPSADFRTAIGLKAQWALGRPSLYGLPRALPGLDLGETVYHPPREPTAMSSAVAAAVLATREESLREAERRRGSAVWLREHIADQPALHEIVSSAGPESSPGYLRFPLLASEGIAGFGDSASRLGIAPSYPMGLSGLSQLAPFVVEGEPRWPGAGRLVDQLVTLPVHSLLSSQDRLRLADRIRAYGTQFIGAGH